MISFVLVYLPAETALVEEHVGRSVGEWDCHFWQKQADILYPRVLLVCMEK